jgi:hypothetical protein
LNENCGANGWATTPTGLRGVSATGSGN